MSTTSGHAAGAPGPVQTPLRSALAARLHGLHEALDAPAVAAALFDTTSGHVVESCTAGSLHVDDDGTCRLRYDVRVRSSTTGRTGTLLVLGRLFPQPRLAQVYLERRVAPLVGAVVARPEVRVLRHPVGLLPAAGLVVHAFPIDPDLPTLAAATEPTSVLPALRSLPGVGSGQRGVAGCTVELAHYPRHGRCVLRYRLRVGAAGSAELRHPLVYGKVHDDDRGARTRLLLHALHRSSPGAALPRSLGYDPRLRLVLLSALSGEPGLGALLRAHAAGLGSGADQLAELVRRCAALVAGLHEARVDPGGARSLAGELDRCGQELALLSHVEPSITRQLAGVLGDVARRARDDVPLGACLAHGDLTPGQFLLDDGRVSLVDLDGVTLAEPALDLGRLRAYARLDAARSADPPTALRRVDAVLEHLLEHYARIRALSCADEAALRRRMPVYTALALLGAALSACRQLKDRRLLTALSLVHEELS